MDREEEERVARERRTSQLVGHRKVSRNAFSAFLNDVMATVCVPRINVESLLSVCIRDFSIGRRNL